MKRLATAGAVLAAVVSSACCWLPLLLLGLGASAGGAAAFFEAYRGWFLGLTGVLLAAAFYFTYRPRPACGPDGSCTVPNRRAQRIGRIVLWSATVAVVGFASFPLWVGTMVGGSVAASSADDDAPQIRYEVTGMHCEGCVGLLEAGLANVPGVRRVSVSYDEKVAVVTTERGARIDPQRVRAAGAEVGFDVTEARSER